MARSSKYGQLDIPRIGEDEPVFILRAQDKLAATAIALYQALAASHDAQAAANAEAEIQRFRQWGGPKKLPD